MVDMKIKQPITYQAGARVRIREDAFGGAEDARMIDIRGKLGKLILRIGTVGSEFMWVWQGDDGSFFYPLDHEIERE